MKTQRKRVIMSECGVITAIVERFWKKKKKSVIRNWNVFVFCNCFRNE